MDLRIDIGIINLNEEDRKSLIEEIKNNLDKYCKDTYYLNQKPVPDGRKA